MSSSDTGGSTGVSLAMVCAVKGYALSIVTGGNVATAVEIGRRLGRDATVVTLMCDSGVKYLSTAPYPEGSRAGR